MKTFALAVLTLCGTLGAAEAETRPQPLFGNDFSAVAPGARPPYVQKGEAVKEADGNVYMKIPAKSYAVLNHSTIFYQYGGKDWKNYRLSFRFRYDGTLHFSTSFRGGGVNFTAKNATYFNHGTKTTKKVDFVVPLEPGKWHTCSIDVLEKEMKLAVDGKPLLTQAIPKDRGAVNFGVHQALDLDDLFVVAVE